MRSLVVWLSLALLSAVYCKHACLQGAHHKAAPGPETGMQECHLYSNCLAVGEGGEYEFIRSYESAEITNAASKRMEQINNK